MIKKPIDESIELALSVLEDGQNQLTPDQIGQLNQIHARATRSEVKNLVTRVDELRLNVRYGTSFEEMIQLGKYNAVDPEITEENFPLKKRYGGEEELGILRFNAAIQTTDILAEFQRRRLRIAELSELLAIGATHPYLQQDFNIAALGAKWRKSKEDPFEIPVLRGSKTRRTLGLRLDAADIAWDTRHGFLGVPEY